MGAGLASDNPLTLRATRVQQTAQGNAGIYHKRGPARHALHAAITLRSLLPGGLLSRFDWLYGEDVTAGTSPQRRTT